MAAAATGFPLVAGALGTLILITTPALLVAMIFTLFLIPLALITLALLGLVVGYSPITLGRGLGVVIVRRRKYGALVAAMLGAGLLSSRSSTSSACSPCWGC